MHSLSTRIIAAIAVAFGFVLHLVADPDPAGAEPGGKVRLALTIEEKADQQSPTETPPTTTAALPAPKKELVAGGVRARLKLSGAGVRFSAGTPAFAEITLTNITNRKLANAEIILETELAEIRDVTGKKIKSEDRGASRVATVSGLRKGKSRKMSVELLLRADTASDIQDSMNRLRITLRPAGGNGDASDSTIVVWPVADCASDFYAHMVAIREMNSDRMGKALKAAWRRNRERPGRWLFSPPVTRSAKRKCRRWRRYWDPRRGRYRHRCTSYRRVAATSAPGVKISKEERALYRFAARFVRSRARDPKLASDQHFGWISQKVATDLRGYLKQDKHPAICTGTISFVSYYDERMEDLGKRADVFAGHLATARKLALEKIAAIRNEIKAEPGGHPGWGAEPLSVLAPDETRTLQELVADLVDLTGDRASVDDIKQAPSPFAALKIAHKAISQEGFKSLSRKTRRTIRHVLSLIEAADYIGSVGHHYAELDQSIIGSLDALKSAHSQHCTCAN